MVLAVWVSCGCWLGELSGLVYDYTFVGFDGLVVILVLICAACLGGLSSVCIDLWFSWFSYLIVLFWLWF